MSIIAAVNSRARRLVLQFRLWWHGMGHEGQRLVGNDRFLARRSIMEQVDFVFRYTPRKSSADWIKSNVFAGHSEADAFEIVAGDDATRRFLEEELIVRDWRRSQNYQADPRDVLEWLAWHAAVGQDAYAEIKFEVVDGRTRLKGLLFARRQAVEKTARGYIVHPSLRYADATSDYPPYEVSEKLMIDARRDLPMLSNRDQTRIVDDYFDEQIAHYEVLNGIRLQAEPELSGLRWDAVRLRSGPSVMDMYPLDARLSVILGQSLIHRRSFFGDKPPFTRYFLLWQHNDCLARLRKLRLAVVDVVNDRIVRVLVNANGLGPARMVAKEYRSAEEESRLFREALLDNSSLVDHYGATLWPDRQDATSAPSGAGEDS